MTTHLLIVDDTLDQAKPRKPQEEELTEILDVVLGQIIQQNPAERNLMEWLEAHVLQLALTQVSQNKSRAARQLGIPRKRLERRVKKYRQEDENISSER
jgi:DNA-binding NtrC family response regulator